MNKGDYETIINIIEYDLENTPHTTTYKKDIKKLIEKLKKEKEEK